jgi:predicted membrane protein (TIGR00267 family)
LLKLGHSTGIIRRYFVVNGFDGALTMLGLTIGFRMGGEVDPQLAVSACLGAAIALGMSGLTSAYISESAERQRDLSALEGAMVADLSGSEHGLAARLIPLVVGLVNGLAPFTIAVLITIPLWLAASGQPLWWSALDLTVTLAITVVFFLGVLLGKVSGRFWLWTGVRAVLIAAITTGLIVLLAP